VHTIRTRLAEPCEQLARNPHPLARLRHKTTRRRCMVVRAVHGEQRGLVDLCHCIRGCIAHAARFIRICREEMVGAYDLSCRLDAPVEHMRAGRVRHIEVCKSHGTTFSAGVCGDNDAESQAKKAEDRGRNRAGKAGGSG